MKYCPKCGTPTEDETHFCPICGYDFQTMESSKSNDESGSVKNPSKTRKWVCLSFFAVILIVTIILLAVFVPKLNSKFRIGVVEEISLGANKDDVREILGQPDISEMNRWGYCSSSLRSYVNKSRDISEAMEAALLRGDLEKAERLNRQYERLMNEVSSKKFSYIEIEFKEDAVTSVLFDKAYAIEPDFKKVQQDELKYTGDGSDIMLPYYDDYTQNSKGVQCALDCTVDEKIYDNGTNLSCTTYFTDGSYYCVHLEAFTTDENYIIWSDAYSDHKTYKPYNFPKITTLGRVSDRGVWQSNVKFKSITIPNSVTSIGNSAFKGCDSLTSITIPDSVTSIGEETFRDCSGLTSITIPDSVTSIGSSAFEGCTDLKNVTIGTGVTSIGERAFYGCTALKSIIIPDSVTSIGKSTFYKCSGLKTVMIGTNVTSIADDAFNDCTKLESISVAEQNQTYSSQDGILYNKTKTKIVLVPRAIKGDVTIPDSVTSIADDVFNDCAELESFSVAEQNQSYSSQDGILYNKTKTKIVLVPRAIKGDVTIPDSVISIEKEKFYGCSRLTSIIIPNSVTSIGERAFYGCTSLTSINIPNSVTSIGKEAFEGCTSLEHITVEKGNPAYRSEKDCLIEITTETLILGCKNSIIPNGVTSIGERAFNGCTSLTSINIPNSIISIGKEAFDGCTGLTIVIWNAGHCASSFSHIFKNCINLTNVTIGTGVTSIGDYAFSGCTGLTNVTIGTGVTSIGDYAFSGCTGLTSLTIESSVTSIGKYAFSGCHNLTNITIPVGVTSIGKYAFSGCTSLANVVWNAENCTEAGSYKNPIFEDCTNLTTVIFGQNVKMIPAYAFYGRTGLTSITIPDGVTSIGDSAFYGCIGLTGELKIPDSVTSIGEKAFRGCTGLKNVTIGTGVTSIEEYAFYKCTGLSNVVWNAENCTKAGDSSSGSIFKDCTNLTTLIFGQNVKMIPAYAFYKCTGLTSITIPDGVTSIGREAFTWCDKLTSVTIGNGVKSIGEYAFTGCSNLTSITFRGMVQEWQTIKKGTSWNSGTGDYTITCTDGTIKPDGTVTYF